MFLLNYFPARIENFGQRIVRHPEVINFMRTTRGESDTGTRRTWQAR